MNIQDFFKIKTWIIIIFIVFIGTGIVVWKLKTSPKIEIQKKEVVEKEIAKKETLKESVLVAYVKDSNLWTEDLISGEINKLTNINEIYQIKNPEIFFYDWVQDQEKIEELVEYEKISLEQRKKYFSERINLFIENEYQGKIISKAYWYKNLRSPFDEDFTEFHPVYGIIPPDSFIRFSPDSEKIVFQKDSEKLLQKCLNNDFSSYGPLPFGDTSIYQESWFAAEFNIFDINTLKTKTIFAIIPYYELFFTTSRTGAFWSPDSKSVAIPYIGTLLINQQGEETKEVFSSENDYFLNHKLNWLKSGKEVLGVLNNITDSSIGSKIVKIDIENGTSKEIFKLEKNHKIVNFQLSPDEKFLIFKEEDKNRINLLDLLSFKVVTILNVEGEVDFKWSDDTSKVAILQQNKKIIIFGIKENKVTKEIEINDISTDSNFSSIESFYWLSENKLAVELYHKIDRDLNEVYLIDLDDFSKKLIFLGDISDLYCKNLENLEIPEYKRIEERQEYIEMKEQAMEEAAPKIVRAHMTAMSIDVKSHYIKYGSYIDFSCNSNKIDSSPSIRERCGTIKELTGAEPVIYASKSAYCAYTKLPGNIYFCIDSKGKCGEIDTDPSKTGYCDGKTFLCPQE